MEEDRDYVAEAIEVLEPFIQSLTELDERGWSLLDQALDTAKIVLGPKSGPPAVGELVDDAMEEVPAGFDGDDIILFLAINASDQMQQRLSSLPQRTRGRVSALVSKYEVWARYIMRSSEPATKLDWTIVHTQKVVVGTDRPRMRLLINRQDGEEFLLELAPRSATRLARNILRGVTTELAEDLARIPRGELKDILEEVKKINDHISEDAE